MESTDSTPFHLVPMVISWVERHRTILENSIENREESLYTYLERLVQNDKHFQMPETTPELGDNVNDDLEDEEDVTTGITSIKSAAMRLNAAAIFCHLNNLDKAKEHLNHLDNLEKLHVRKENLEVVKCLRDSMKQALGLAVPPEAIPLLLQTQIGLQDVGNPQLAAMLKFMEGNLGIVMGIPEERVLDLQKQVINMDPKCHAWYHYAFWTQRRIRRNIHRAVSSRLECSSELEELWATKGYQNGPLDFIAIVDYATLLKDGLWIQRVASWNNDETLNKKYEDCKSLFR